MAKAPAQEDIDTLYTATLAELQRESGTIKAAAQRAFVALKQEGQPWRTKPIGSSAALAMLVYFSDAQNAELRRYLPAEAFANVHRERNNTLHDLLYGYEGDAREDFLTAVATGTPRPQLAIDFGIPIQQVGEVLRAIIDRRYTDLAVSQQGGGQNYLANKIRMTAAEKPEWASLAHCVVSALLGNGQQITPPNAWPLPVPTHELDILARLEGARASAEDKKHLRPEASMLTSLSGETASDHMPTASGKAPFAQRVAAEIGGGRVVGKDWVGGSSGGR